VKISFAVFVIASAASRGARFFLEGLLFFYFGKKAKKIIDKYFNVLCIAFTVMVIFGFYLLKFIF